MTSFPSAIAVKPSNISDGLAILASHVGTNWDETVSMQSELLGAGTGAFIMDIRPSAAGNTVIRTRQSSGDTVDRFNFNGNGKLFWGTGGASSDVQLERSAARFLKLTGSFDVRAQNSSEIALNVYGAASTSASFIKVLDSTGATTFLDLSSAGQLKIPATGSSAGLQIGGDTLLYRSATSTLLVNNALQVNGAFNLTNGTSLLTARVATATTTQVVGTAVTGDANDRFQILADGTHKWGPASTTPDTSLARSGVNALTTTAGINMGTSQVNGDLTVTGNLTVSGSTSSTPSNDVAVGAAYSFAALAGSATSTLKFKSSVTSDTNNRFQVTADGTHSWGPGNAAVDTALSRSGVNALTTTAALTIGALTTTGVSNSGTYNDITLAAANTLKALAGSATSTLKLRTSVTTDTNDRFTIQADGTHNWGSGSAATDTSLNRSGSNALTTTATVNVGSLVSTGAVSGTNVTASGTLTAGSLAFTSDLTLAASAKLVSILSTAASTPKIQFQVSSDSTLRYQVTADGTTTWGAGTGGLSQSIAYQDANTLKTSGAWQVGTNLPLIGATSLISLLQHSTATNVAYSSRISTDSINRFQITAEGAHSWGPGTGALDTTLTRSASGVLSAGSGSFLGTNVQVAAGGAFQGLLGTATSTLKLQTSVAADTNDRFELFADGTHKWGPGNAVVDTFLSRTAAGDLLIDRSTTAKTRLSLRRPDGTIRWISIDNNDQLLIEVS